MKREQNTNNICSSMTIVAVIRTRCLWSVRRVAHLNAAFLVVNNNFLNIAQKVFKTTAF